MRLDAHDHAQVQITCTIMKIALRSCTKQSDDRLLNLLARDDPPPESLLIIKRKKIEQRTKNTLFRGICMNLYANRHDQIC